MNRNSFSTQKIKDSLIWAAKWRACTKCGAAIGKPCENLNDRKRGKVSLTANPHESRIDWEMLYEKLKARGYR